MSSTQPRGKAAGTLTASRRDTLQTQLASYTAQVGELTAPPKAQRPWKYVVIHHSATPSGGLDAIDREHRERIGSDGCGYHFVIGNGTDTPDGQIEVAVRWSNQKGGMHCRDGKLPDINEYGIGICLVGDFEQSQPTPRQIEATRALVAYLSQRYTIPANHVNTHAQVAESPTVCPGPKFPMDQILNSTTTPLANR